MGLFPEPHTDFIFAIICEELGLIGGLLVITLEFFIVYRAFQFAIKHHHIFINLCVLGLPHTLEAKRL
ncbi:FtsW/RodA/SpoVE family cell cycle protein [Staphylococcus aureus]|nr:FtsW/RodA/SpoVE family cell cycle protein [Staphylococcus aureus]